MRQRNLATIGGIATLVALSLLLVPIVPYSISFTMPNAFRPEGVTTCNMLFGGRAIVNFTVYQQCLDKYRYPPANITGRSAIPYALLGLGPPPFPREYLVTQGNTSAILYLRGGSIEAAESYFVPVTSLNPVGIIRIANESITLSQVGLLDINATFMNVGKERIDDLQVRLVDPPRGFGQNYTQNGINWIGFYPTQCASNLVPQSYCVASFLAFGNVNDTQQFHFSIEAVGRIGGQYFAYQQSFSGSNPGRHLDAAWVADLMRAVNSARNGTKLQEDKTLDSFAQLRFKTASANYGISDYGFTDDVIRFLPSAALPVGETILYPGKYLAIQYASILQQSAPGHWSVLTDSKYTHYGFYIGEGPVIVAREPCAVTEFPSSNVNMTAFLTSHGCAYDITQGPWLLVEVGR